MKQQNRVTPKPRSNAWYGWIPDLPDYRDLMYGAVRKIPRKLPKSVDLRPGCSKVENQGELGSCGPNALAGALEFLELKDKVPFLDFSRLFIYYNTRVLEGTVDQDSGVMIRDAVKCVSKQGVCSEKNWAYVISQFKKKPGAACYREALKYQVLNYHRIANLDEMKTCLADGFPFVFGFSVYDGFETQAMAKTGVLNMPKPSEHMQGGHAVLGVGYDDAKKRLIVRNSWGEDWGMKGYFTMPYAYVESRDLSDDFWTIRSGEQM
jgi:C1A family cysteine protease